MGSGPKTKVRSIVPLGRYGTTDDIANTAIFLASPGGNFITGTNIVVDGLQWQAVGRSDVGKKRQNPKYDAEAKRVPREGHRLKRTCKGCASEVMNSEFCFLYAECVSCANFL